MGQSNFFKIYNASAGTGKTFNLVKDYIVLLLKSDNISLYKNILAVTFTNKAVNEMKHRVINLLVNYTNCISIEPAVTEIIKKETGLNKNEIFKKSSKILKNLLINILLKLNKFLFFKNINKKTKLNHEEIVVAIGMIIKPIDLKK